jgi:hypothetical protein
LIEHHLSVFPTTDFVGIAKRIFFGYRTRADQQALARIREGDGAADGFGSPADVRAGIWRVTREVDASGVFSAGSFALERDLNRPKSRRLVRPSLPPDQATALSARNIHSAKFISGAALLWLISCRWTPLHDCSGMGLREASGE